MRGSPAQAVSADEATRSWASASSASTGTAAGATAHRACTRCSGETEFTAATSALRA
jgi:hypothetical protein